MGLSPFLARLAVQATRVLVSRPRASGRLGWSLSNSYSVAGGG